MDLHQQFLVHGEVKEGWGKGTLKSSNSIKTSSISKWYWCVNIFGARVYGVEKYGWVCQVPGRFHGGMPGPRAILVEKWVFLVPDPFWGGVCPGVGIFRGGVGIPESRRSGYTRGQGVYQRGVSGYIPGHSTWKTHPQY